MNRAQLLRDLPSVDEVLREEKIAALSQRSAHGNLVQWIRQAIDEIRQRILSGDFAESQIEKSMDSVVARVQQNAQSDQGQSLQAVINATGILLHTNLGRAPMAQRAIERARQAAAFTNVELDLLSGKRSKRGKRVLQLLALLTGAEDVIVVNNCAAATMLVLQAIAGGKEVIISRGQLVEIGGGFRLPNVFESAGVRLREIGTTNRTYVRDYEEAINDETAAILRVHHSNFRLTGFVTEPTIGDLVACNRPGNLPVIDDVGSGCVYDMEQFGLNEPNVIDSVAAGADLTLFSGDKLFGGPQAGIVVGKKVWIDQLRSSPMMRALRVDKLTLAALEATTEIHLENSAHEELPLVKMLTRAPEEIKAVCQTIAAQLPTIGQLEIHVVPSESQVGGGSVPGLGIASFAIRIGGCKVDELARWLRNCKTPVQSRVANDCLWLDLRTVADFEVESLTLAVADGLRWISNAPSSSSPE